MDNDDYDTGYNDDYDEVSERYAEDQMERALLGE